MNRRINRQGQSLRLGEITVESNWVLTLEMVVLFVIVGAMLIWKIRILAFGIVTGHVSALAIVNVIYYFLFAFAIRGKFVKAALIMMGMETAYRLALHYAHAPLSLRHQADVGGYVIDQVALTIILIAIVYWFKSVVRRTSPSSTGDPGL